ncbi:MAM and LDL-receptor class A domain-containing protein 1-like [Mya arenaria]|nr:MAM and LDL-receptor class A domain-containing protein 1-like [Mya arenaria]
MDIKKWADIGYSFLIGGDGNVYEGRGWKFVGAHTYGYNRVSSAAAFIGNFTSLLPNAKAIKAVDILIECGVHRGKIKPSYTLLGHRDAKKSDTKCPGDALYREIQTWTNYPGSGKTIDRDICERSQGPSDQESHLDMCNASGKFCGWHQDGPLFWSKQRGQANRPGITGPSSDSTGSLTGYYLLADATDSTAYKSVKMYSDQYPYDSSDHSFYCVDFQYHMHGDDVGTLSLKLGLNDMWFQRYRETVWHISGDHGNRWIRKRVTVETAISIFEGKMHFEFIATFGGSYSGDIALDNIRIGKGRCEMASTDVATSWLSSSQMQSLKEQLKIDEGVKYTIYKDSLDKLTFGIGHLITKNDPEYGKPVGTPVSEERVDAVFKTDVAEAVKLTQSIYNPGCQTWPGEVKEIMVNMAFNLGGNLKKFTNLKTALDDRNWQKAADEMKDSRWYTQVGKRAVRLVERMRNVKEK